MRFVALSLIILPGSAFAACTPADMSIKQPKLQARMGTVRIVGELVSKCDEAASVSLTFVFRGKAGGVVGLGKPWVVPQRIAPRGSLPFDDYASTVEVPEKAEPLIAVGP